jgi:hypothetical protein
MTFFKNISLSIWGPAFYAELSTKSLWFSLWYLVRLSLILGAIATIWYVPGIFHFFSKATVDSFVTKYPADLLITIHNGKTSINKPEPYTLTNSEGEKPKSLLVVDTQTAFTSQQFIDYETVALLKKDSLIVAESNGLKIIPLTNVKDFTLSRATLEGWGSAFSPYLGLIASLVSLLLFVFLASANFNIVLYLLFVALVVWLLSYLLKWHLMYKEAYKIALHAATLPLILATLLPLLHVSRPFLSFTLMLILIAIANMTHRQEHPTVEVSQTTHT